MATGKPAKKKTKPAPIPAPPASPKAVPTPPSPTPSKTSSAPFKTALAPFKTAVTQNYTATMLAPISQASKEKAAEHGMVIVNLGELATVGITSAAVAEWNHTRQASQVWTWRFVELLGGGVVLAYNGTRNTLGRIGLGVFTGGLAETLIDSTPGLTGARVSPAWEVPVTYFE